MIPALALIVGKARKILDFGLTYVLLHLLMISWLSSFPVAVGWWVMQGGCACAVIVLAEILSMKLETAEIKIETILADKDPKRKMYAELQRLRKIKV